MINLSPRVRIGMRVWDEMYIEKVKDVDEFPPPSGNPILVARLAGESRVHILFALLDDLPTYLGNNSAIPILVSEPVRLRIAGSAHIVNRSIASSAGGPNSSDRFSSNPLEKA